MSTPPTVTGPWQGRYAVTPLHRDPDTRVGARVGAVWHPGLEGARSRSPDLGRDLLSMVAFFTAFDVLVLLLLLATGWADPADAVRFVLVGTALCLPLVVAVCWRSMAHRTLDGGPAVLFEDRDAEEGPTAVEVCRLRSIGVVDRPSGLALVLRQSGTVLEVPFGLLEGNPRLWAHVHAGLVTSARAGADVDERARSLLRLPAAAAC